MPPLHSTYLSYTTLPNFKIFLKFILWKISFARAQSGPRAGKLADVWATGCLSANPLEIAVSPFRLRDITCLCLLECFLAGIVLVFTVLDESYSFCGFLHWLTLSWMKMNVDVNTLWNTNAFRTGSRKLLCSIVCTVSLQPLTLGGGVTLHRLGSMLHLTFTLSHHYIYVHINYYVVNILFCHNFFVIYFVNVFTFSINLISAPLISHAISGHDKIIKLWILLIKCCCYFCFLANLFVSFYCFSSENWDWTEFNIFAIYWPFGCFANCLLLCRLEINFWGVCLQTSNCMLCLWYF